MKKMLMIMAMCLTLTAIAHAAQPVKAPKLIDGDFKQTKTSAMLDKPQTLTGHLHYEAATAKTPMCLRWEYDGIDLGFVSCGKEQKANPKVRKVTELIVSCISGAYNNADSGFTMTTNAKHEVVLTPKRQDLKRMFRQVRIAMNATTNLADKVTIVEQNGDETVISFKNMKQE